MFITPLPALNKDDLKSGVISRQCLSLSHSYLPAYGSGHIGNSEMNYWLKILSSVMEFIDDRQSTVQRLPSKSQEWQEHSGFHAYKVTETVIRWRCKKDTETSRDWWWQFLALQFIPAHEMTSSEGVSDWKNLDDKFKVTNKLIPDTYAELIKATELWYDD